MQYIDKNTHITLGNAIIHRLLENNWNKAESNYTNIDYTNGLCDNRQTYYTELCHVLLENQNNLCCYCMKELESIMTTLEHIIPHRVSTGDFPKYLTVNNLKNHVIHKDNFDKNIYIIPPPKYPHDIAYHNLVASCNSNTSCNHFRSDKFIFPLMYDAEIENMVQYNEEGIAFNEVYLDELEKTGISTNQELKMYRKIWKELATQKDTPEEVTDDDIELVVLTLDGDKKYQKMLTNFYGKPSKKEDLKKFKWFFYYYKTANLH